MLFHSYQFIFGFLPITFIGFALIRQKLSHNFSLVWLVAASIAFYASWSEVYVLLLIVSILFNYLLGQLIQKNLQNHRLASYLLVFGIASNLAMLGYFKYTNFLIDNINTIFDLSMAKMSIALPVGISFFTFYQIIYLVGVYSQQAEKQNLLNYFLFVTFFPYVTAGPIVLQQEILPQYTQQNKQEFKLDGLVIGLSIFSIGLFKKLVFADSLAPYSEAVFDAANKSMLGATDAWLGALAYSLQLYFDFSGYSDMAIGLGCMFGIKLPLNFNSPYKAVSIIDFWRRWHITMTRFFTTFVFSPIAVRLMRLSLKKAYSPALTFIISIALPTIFTFTVAGLWHGAGWNFVIFGLLHGLALAVNHAWRETRLPSPSPLVGWILTMGVVITGLVIFRAQTLAAAWSILQAMVGFNQVFGDGNIPRFINTFSVLPWIVTLSAITLLAPNTQELMCEFSATTDTLEAESLRWPKWLVWRPTMGWALFCTTLFVVAIFSMKGNTDFLYYQF